MYNIIVTILLALINQSNAKIDAQDSMNKSSSNYKLFNRVHNVSPVLHVNMVETMLRKPSSLTTPQNKIRSHGWLPNSQVRNFHAPLAQFPRLAPSMTCKSRGHAVAAYTKDEDIPDHYGALGLRTKSVSKEEIKAAYRRKMKLYHPDKAGARNLTEQEQELGKAAIAAYQVLTDAEKRQHYDAISPWTVKANLDINSEPGLVKAFECTEEDTIYLKDPEVTEDDVLQFVRDWATFQPFCSELPLPLPIQVDEIEGGVRVAGIGIDDNRNLKLVGELHLMVCGGEGDGTQLVVARCGTDNNGFPGDKTLMRRLRKSLEMKYGSPGLMAGLGRSFHTAFMSMIDGHLAGGAIDNAYYLRTLKDASKGKCVCGLNVCVCKKGIKKGREKIQTLH